MCDTTDMVTHLSEHVQNDTLLDCYLNAAQARLNSKFQTPINYL